MIPRRAACLGFLTAIGLLVAGAGPARAQTTAAAGGKVVLQGAGATFPAPLYRKWIGVFTEQNPDVGVEYKEVGSGEGVQRFVAQSVDFAASDAAMTDEQMARVPNGTRLVPTTAGMVVLAYNLPGVEGALKLSRDVYADIFLRKIVTWNDPRLQALNPDMKLPNRSIVLAARQDRSGTTFALANHLDAVSPEWRRGPGVGYAIDWSGRAMLARGNEGVAGLVKSSAGALGYMEYGFAERLRLQMARLQNKEGRYVTPSDRSGQAALAGAARQMPDNLRLYLPDPDGTDSYPIVSLTWLLLYERYPDPQKSAALKRFVTWGLSFGQSFGPELGYIALPADVASRSRAALERIQ
ncbi:MAG TPA: phosphate ABC transporter substrate-binding protein PstS [Methylomirabilota bacterium]|nr:phosphate ABC transporter substrate-binding protein PstS [Methylomirabilota bacterium]